MTALLTWFRTTAGTLPGWLATTAALVVGVFLLVVVMHLFKRVVFRLLGLLVSVGFGVITHLALHPVFVALLARYTSWRGSS